MFGEYAQIASYLQPARDAALQKDGYYQEPLPTYLRPVYQPQQPWSNGRTKSGLTEDFIMVAEFSELEGPKPVMTIPKDGGANFDQNSFSVRILAVDHQNPSEGFTISEDAQVVLSDMEIGVFAFVHHLVLFDNTARGFVRPYCIAYITTDQRKLMYFYEELSWQFKKVARYLKYGNRMLFVADLERHLKDLDHTKGFLLNQVSKMRLRDDMPANQSQEVRKNAENELYRGLQTIRQSVIEIKDILTILKPLLTDKKLEARFRQLEDRAFQRSSPSGPDNLSLQEDWFNDLSSLDGLDTRCGSLSEPRMSPLALFKPRDYKPLLVETKKAKRFNAPLRGLHELCSWGAKEGLRKLRHIHEFFKRELTILELERNESRLFRPACGIISHGQCVTGNFLSGVHMKKSQNMLGEDEDEPMLNWGSVGSQDSLDSFKSAGSCLSLMGPHNASLSSIQTYDSQSGHMFRSASSSPAHEISLLAENEYYPGLERSVEVEGEEEESTTESKNIFYLPLNDASKTSLAESEDGPQQVRKSVEVDKFIPGAQVEKVDEAGTQQERLQDNNITLKSNLSFFSVCSPSELPAGEEIVGLDEKSMFDIEGFYRGEDDDTSMTGESNSRNNDEESVSGLVQKSSQSLSKEIGQNIPNAKHLTGVVSTGKELKHGREIQNSESLKDAKSIQNISCDNNQQRLQPGVVGDSKTSTLTNLILSHPPGANPNLSDNSQQALPLTGSGQDNDGRKFELSDDNVLSKSDSDSNKIMVDSSLNRLDKNENNSASLKQSGKRDSKLAVLLEQVDNQELGSDVDFIPAIASFVNSSTSGKPETLPSSSSNVLVKGTQASLQGQENSKAVSSVPAVLQSSNNNSSKDVTLTQQPGTASLNQPQFPHQIMGRTHPGLRAIQSAPCIEDNSVRIRAESDASSAFTEISIRELFPHLISPASSSPNSKDMLLSCGSCDGCEPTDCNEDYTDIPYPATTGTWKPRGGVYSLGDWINNIGPGRPGFCLSEVLSTYQNLQHIIYSLLSGRPVLVAGSAKQEQDVTKLVNALAVFVPSARRKRHAVLEWTSKPPRIADLTKLRLVGVCRPERKSIGSFIPSAIKKACTLVDMEKRTFLAPPYQGQMISALLAKKKVLKNEVLLLSYIEWWLMDVLAKAFSFFHTFCIGSTGSILSSHNPIEQRDAYQATVSAILGNFGIRDSDRDIIEHLAEMAKISRMEPSVWHGVEQGSVVYPLTLHHTICQAFKL